jgi:hypothetical protein
MTTPVNNIPVSVNYTDRDYYAIRSELIARIQDRVPEWSGDDPADFGIALVEAFAYMGDLVNYYIDRIANESFIDTAIQRQSILNIAKTYGYYPAGYRSAYITIQFTNESATNIVIPAGTQVTADVVYNDTIQQVPYTTMADAVVLAASGGVNGVASVSAFQGKDISTQAANASTGGSDIAGELVATSDGQPDQSYPLEENEIVDNSIKIYVQNGTTYELWQQVVHISDYGPNDAVYSISTDADNYVYVNFGDGVSGTIPTIGAGIKAVYNVGGGTIGNIATNLVDTIVYIPGKTDAQVSAIQAAVTVTNTSVGLGGSDPESNDNIRINAPKALSTLNRAVTLSDYANLSLTVSEVGKANATAEIWNSVTLYIAPSRNDGDGDLYPGYTDNPNAGGTITPEWTRIQSNVKTYLEDKVQIGTSVTISPPSYVPVTLSVQYTKLSTYTISQVETNIKYALVNDFSFNYVNFGDVIQGEEIEFRLRQVDGVKSAKVLLLYRTGGIAERSVLIAAANELFVFDEDNLSVGAASEVATLSGLSSNTGTLSPAFASTFLNYNLTVPNGTSSITITPTKTDTTATIKVNGTPVTSGSGTSIATAVGTTTISVVVTAGDSTTIKTYKVTVTRVS